MIRNYIIPQDNNIIITVPPNYIGKPVEVLVYTLDELEKDKKQDAQTMDFKHSIKQSKEDPIMKEREFGCAKNAFVIKDGFDDPLEDFNDYQ